MSYVAGDKVDCVHKAESANAVYRHAREGGFPADRGTEIAAIIGPQTAGPALESHCPRLSTGAASRGRRRESCVFAEEYE